MSRLHPTKVKHCAAPSKFLLRVFRVFPFEHFSVCNTNIVHEHHEAQNHRPDLLVLQQLIAANDPLTAGQGLVSVAMNAENLHGTATMDGNYSLVSPLPTVASSFTTAIIAWCATCSGPRKWPSQARAI